MTENSSSVAIDTTAIIRESNLGLYCEIGERARLLHVELGDYSFVANDSIIANATIGKFCSIGEMTRINPDKDPTQRPSQSRFTYFSSRYFDDVNNDEDVFEWRRFHAVTIGHDVCIGHGAIVLPGRHIGNGAVVLAGAVVTKDVSEYTVVQGNPAQILRVRFPSDIAHRLQRIAWWDWPRDRLHAALADFRQLPVERFVEKYEHSSVVSMVRDH
jgi:phosphonate metabolism protein (transferase hexapeptide repeat family)